MRFGISHAVATALSPQCRGGFIIINKKIPFSQLRQFLLHLGFSEANVSGSALVFEYVPSQALLFYRVYKPADAVDAGDLAKTRRFLDERGLLAADEFEEALHKAPV
jgi:hypothetical protein